MLNFEKRKQNKFELLSPFCHVFLYIFLYLVAIKDFLIFEMFLFWCASCLFLLPLSSTLDVSIDGWRARLNTSGSHWCSLMGFIDSLIRIWSALCLSSTITYTSHSPPSYLFFCHSHFLHCLSCFSFDKSVCVKGVITGLWQTEHSNRRSHFVDYNYVV